jgi:hypothetical protein
MSIHQMIASHPEVHGHLNEALATAVRHSMFCAVICTSCADACSAEPMDMRQCIRTCMDCADVCQATMTVATRRTGTNETVIRAMLVACIQTCEICADECDRHDHEHCRQCATMCRECAADCHKALATMLPTC